MNASKTLHVAPRYVKFLALNVLLLSLQACAPSPSAHSGSSVAQAFETSGIVPSQPYTRTIFSSSNF